MSVLLRNKIPFFPIDRFLVPSCCKDYFLEKSMGWLVQSIVASGYRFLRIAWHDIFSLSLYFPRDLAESRANTHLLVKYEY